VLPIYQKNYIHVLISNVLASCLLAILASVYQQLSHYRSMTIRQQQFKCFHHTIQADTFRNVVIRRGIFSRQLHTPPLPVTHVPVGYS